MKKQLLTAKEASNMLGLCEATLWRIARDGRWPEGTVRLPGSLAVRFRLAEIEKLIGHSEPDQAA